MNSRLAVILLGLASSATLVAGAPARSDGPSQPGQTRSADRPEKNDIDEARTDRKPVRRSITETRSIRSDDDQMITTDIHGPDTNFNQAEHPEPPMPPASPDGPLVFSPSSDRKWEAGHFWIETSGERKVSMKIEPLVRQLGEAKSDSEREKLKANLSEILEQQFNLRQKRHQTEIEALETQISKLKQLSAKRQENRREIISRRIDQVVRESQGLGW